MKTKIFYITIFSCFCCTFAFAQQERSNIKKGNKEYEKQRFTEAEIEYREALQKNQKSVEANFNLGNALYRQGKYDSAREHFQVVALTEKDRNKKVAAGAFHNIGNTFMEEKDYAKSVSAYREALKLNPKDDETRYNLALANALLKQQEQQQQNQQNQNNDDKDDKNKDQQNQNQQQQNEQQQEQQRQENNRSRENAQQLLDAFAEDEKELLQKINEAKPQKVNTRTIEKDW